MKDQGIHYKISLRWEIFVVRHYWNDPMAIHINKDQEKIVADNHEEISSGPEAENRMDYKNNEIGRETGENTPNEEAVKNRFIDTVNNGCLQLKP